MKPTIKRNYNIKWHLKELRLFKVNHFKVTGKPTKYFMTPHIGSEDTWQPKLLKIADSDHPTVVRGPLAMEPPRISA